MAFWSRPSMVLTVLAIAALGTLWSSAARAGEEVVYRKMPWMTRCELDDKTRERNCSIWRSLASPALKTENPNRLVLVINAVDDYAFVQTAPFAPASIAIDGNPALPFDQCLAPTMCMLEPGMASDLRRQLESGGEMRLSFRDKDGGTTTVAYDLADYPSAAAAAKQWLSQP